MQSLQWPLPNLMEARCSGSAVQHSCVTHTILVPNQMATAISAWSRIGHPFLYINLHPGLQDKVAEIVAGLVEEDRWAEGILQGMRVG